MNLNRIIDVIALAALLVLAYVLFVVVPFEAYADAECLSKGYAKSHTTITFDRYCSNLDGAVTVKVEKQN